MALSYFAGTFNALDYNYGGSSGGAAALQVTSGSTGTGAYTITCVPAALYTPAGKPIPISTATPINVGADSGFDTNITPTTVSQSGLNTLLITATFTYAHGAGAQVSSATFGLAEAMLAAKNYGGGTVVVDAKWFQTGGTQAILDAAIQYAGVSVENNSGTGSAGVETQTFTLTNAQILALNTTPVQLLPTTDATSFYQILEAVLVNKNTGVAYASGGVIEVGYGATVATQALSGTVAATFLTSPVVPQVISLAGAALSGTLATYAAKPIYVNNATGNFTTGTGTLEITLVYIKVST